MVDDQRVFPPLEGLSFSEFQVTNRRSSISNVSADDELVQFLMRLSFEERDPKLSQAVKIFQHTKSSMYKNVGRISNPNIEGILQGIQRFWFALILFAFNRLKSSHIDSSSESEKFTTYRNIFDFFAKAPKFFANSGPALLHIYSENKPKFDIVNMSGRDWTWRVLGSLPSKPSAELDHFLHEAGGAALKEDVACRAQTLMESVFSTRVLELYSRSKWHDADLWTQKRREDALKVYYMFLETICNIDPDAVYLLSNNQFHRCALACSAELVLANADEYYPIWLPDILKLTGITAFDLCKIIESFLKCEFPKALSEHLSTLMERLLESMIWEKGSSMYDALIISRPHLSEEIVRLGLVKKSMALCDAVVTDFPVSTNSGRYLTAPCYKKQSYKERRELCCSGFGPSKVEPLPLRPAFASPNPGEDDVGTCTADTVLNLMLDKFIELSAFRVECLVQISGLGEYMYFEETVNCLVQLIFSQQTDLFFNRHVDQIVICSVYSVVNILQPKELTFEQILGNYSKLLDTKKLVCDSVFVDWAQVPHTHSDEKSGENYIDIGAFYTAIFDPCVKPLLANLGLSKDATLKPCSPMDLEKSMDWASATIDWLGGKLKLPQHVVETVRCFVKEIFKRKTALCFNRHIDQIVLCSLYHVPKVLKMNISFVESVQNYLKLPDRGLQVIRRIFVDWSQIHYSDKTGVEHVNILTFYYEIYVVSVKSLVAKLGLSGASPKPDLLPEVHRNSKSQYSESSNLSALPEQVCSAHLAPPAQSSLLKTLELASDTIEELVERLELSQHIKETVHCFVKQVFSQHTALSLNRDIDQIVVCSIYCVVKASKLKLPFKDVIEAYLKLPRASPQIHRVYMDSQETTGENHIDIFTFYKKFFSPSVKALLMELDLAGASLKSNFPLQEDQPPGTSSATPFPHLSDMASKKYPTHFAGAHPVLIPLGQHNQ